MRRGFLVAAAFAAAISLAALPFRASAQVAAGAGAAAQSGALAGASADSIYAPSSTSTFNYPHQPPAMGMGSFGQGANPCANGRGFMIGTGWVGVGYNEATSGKQCNDRLTAEELMRFAQTYHDPAAAVAAKLVLCASNPNILIQCQRAGLYTTDPEPMYSNYGAPAPAAYDPQVSQAAADPPAQHPATAHGVSVQQWAATCQENYRLTGNKKWFDNCIAASHQPQG